MGKLLLAALMGGVVAAALTFFLMTSLGAGERRAEVEQRMAKAETTAQGAEERVDVVTRRLELLTKRMDGAARDHARSLAQIEEALATRRPDAEGAEAPAGSTAPDGTPYVSRAEMEAAIAKARTGGGLAAAGAGVVQQKSLEEIAQEMGLTAAEEASVRQAFRESEEEFVRCLFGDRPLPDVVAELRGAKEDPDKLESVMTQAVTNGFQNLGKLMTLEARTKKKVEGVLGKDRAKDLLSRPHKPVLGDEFQRVFSDLDLD